MPRKRYKKDNGNGFNGNGYKEEKSASLSLKLRNIGGPVPVTPDQKHALKTIINNQITILYGCAGVGKSFLATLYGLCEFSKGTYKKLVFTRPCIEAGEKLGALPGDGNLKILPYMMPIFDILETKISREDITYCVENGKIVTLPFAFLRGNTFNDSFVLADECQNATPKQIRLLLTRIGNNTKMVITGDILQSDISERNGLADAIERLSGIDGIGIVKLSDDSIIRNPIIKEIEDRYSK